jgi:hypothetical protein
MTAKAKTKTDKKPKQENSVKDKQKQLDRELADSFPASDPPSVTQPSVKPALPNVSLPAERRNGSCRSAACLLTGSTASNGDAVQVLRPGSPRKAAAIVQKLALRGLCNSIDAQILP